jgi:hypothetical protein
MAFYHFQVNSQDIKTIIPQERWQFENFQHSTSKAEGLSSLSNQVLFLSLMCIAHS